jgi:hypothetical protein
MATEHTMMPCPGAVWEDFIGLDPDAPLWQTPEGEWVVLWRGENAPLMLSTLPEWNDVIAEAEVELTADADGRVRRRGTLVAADSPDWVVPAPLRARALTS